MKKKFGILFDSSCGLSKKETEALGFYFIPIIIEFNGKEYYSGINIDNNFLYKHLTPESDIKTAAVKLGELKKTFDVMLTKYENVLFVSLSKHLSSINSIGKKLAEEYDGKVVVYDSELITPWIKTRIKEIANVYNAGGTIEDIIKILDRQRGLAAAMVTPNNLSFLYRGGRITRSQYLAGNLLKIFPTIIVENGAINNNDVIKTRTINRAYEKMIQFTLEQNQKFKEMGYETKIIVLNINAKSNFKIFKELLGKADIHTYSETILSSDIIAHLGPNAIGIGVLII